MVSKSAGRQAADPSNHLCISYPSADMPRQSIHQNIEILNTQCPAGDMFYISDRAHTLHSRSDFWGLVLHFCRRSRRGGGNVGIPAFGISIFPSPNHLPLDLHPKVAPPAVCACRWRAMGTVEK